MTCRSSLNRRTWATFLAGALPGWALANAPVTVLVPADVLADHEAQKPLRRDVAELRLLMESIARPAQLLPMPSTARLLTELRASRGLVGGTSFTKSDIDLSDGHLALSAPLVLDGEFEAGLYTLPDHPAQHQATERPSFSHWTALCNRTWSGDWAALQRLSLKEVQHVSSWPVMVRMLAARRADLVLAPFSSKPDLAIHAEGVTLLPIPGIKVALPGSRHFVMAAQHAMFSAFRDSLDAGIAARRADGRLRRAYEDSGFFSARARKWRLL